MFIADSMKFPVFHFQKRPVKREKFNYAGLSFAGACGNPRFIIYFKHFALFLLPGFSVTRSGGIWTRLLTGTGIFRWLCLNVCYKYPGI